MSPSSIRRASAQFVREMTVTVSVVVAMVATVLAVAAISGPTPVSAAPAATANAFALRVESARQWIPAGINAGTPIPHYHWLVTEDDTGDPSKYGTNLPATDTGNSNYACSPQSLGGDPAYPANCQWPGTHSAKGGTSAEVVAQGDETAFAPDANGNPTRSIDTSGWVPNDHNPNRSYMVSVTADGFTVPGCTVSPTVTCHVDGFKIDAAYFSFPMVPSGPVAGSGLVTVSMQPYPLPLTTVRMKVWNDLQTNGAYDTGEPGLAGFEGHIDDVLGPVTTDWYGNPLCTTYQHDGAGLMLFDASGHPVVQTIGGHCLSDADGVITIPYLGADRYASTVTAPNGQTWYQTSTLEGWHDWDTWSIQGWNGYDPEFVQGAEAFPFAEFGFVQLQAGASATTCCNYASPAATGSIKGTVVGIGEYAPQVGGLNFGGQGKHIIENINQPLLSLVDTNRDDTTVYVGRGNADGTFSITNVPDGTYVMSVWDEDQAYLLTETNLTVTGGQALDMGALDVAAWHSQVYGKVCNDTNRNGKCDPGEPGIPNLALNLLDRDNKVAFYGDNTARTDSQGNYRFPRTYPLGQWVVAQGYWEQFYTVGVTYQTNNQPTETTVMANGGFVDVSTFNLIGDQTRMDWAVHTYETDPNLGPTTGGIVGEVVATTTRNETDARFQATETYEPGLPGAPVHLYAPVKCAPADPTIPTGDSCTTETTSFGSANYLTDTATGAIVRGPEMASPYTSETWQRPQDCTARGYDGTPVVEQVLPPSTGGHDCLEAPLMSSQVGDNSVGPFMQVNGNYGFTQGCYDVAGQPAQYDDSAASGCAAGATLQTLKPGDYLVNAESPKQADGTASYQVVKEEDVNIFSGDQLAPPGETPNPLPTPNRTPPATVTPAIPPFPCAGPKHTVNVVTTRAAAQFDPTDPTNPAKTGVYNPDFVNGGGSPFQGQSRPLCDTRLVTVRNGRSATPNFHMMPTSDVPLPGRIFGIVVDDVNLSVNPKELFYGEKKGLGNMPIGIYDFANHLVKTIQTDPNGAFEVELPSTSSYNCPLPAGPCPGIYRFLGNDPGEPGRLNANYDPNYRTIGGFFEVWPGVSLPADLAPTPTSFAIENPGTQNTAPAACALNDPARPTAPKVPEFFAVDKVDIASGATGTGRDVTISGQDFGAATGSLLIDGSTNAAWTVSSWTDTTIVVRAPTNAPGPHQVLVRSANGQRAVNGITVHLLGGSGPNAYNPTILRVGPGQTYDPAAASHNAGGYEHAIQDALDAAASSSSNELVVVYPGPTATFNPFGAYFENLVMHSPAKLQGFGPGGIRASDGAHVAGTVLDGLGFGTDSARDAGWQTTIANVGTISGPGGQPLNTATAAVPEGEVILAVATSASPYGPSFKAAIDGMTIQNGDVMDFVPNVDTLGNGAQVGGGNNTPTNPNQGGGIVAFASTKFLEITDDVVKSNTGAYGGAIRIGTPLVGDNNNDGIRIANNRLLHNGGSNLAGAVGIFNGAYGYEVANNDVCGNFSAEYGGGISHFGLSGALSSTGSRTTGTLVPPSIHDNRVYFNGSYDHGAGIAIAGEPSTSLTSFGNGAGPVDLYNNTIQANLADDDGGGLAFLTAGNFPYNVYNNVIVNNISAHEGGGVAIDNAPNVRFYNNTVMKNLTTATAATSNGQPAPAGLSTAPNNTFLQATLPAGSPTYSNPLMFNNVFWDNRAGRWDGANIVGIGGLVWSGGVQVPDPAPIDYWDMGVPGTTSQLSPTNSVLHSETTSHSDVVASPTNRVDQDPAVNAPYDTTVYSQPWRGNPNFVANIIVAQDVPFSIMGDYHLSGTGSSAFNLGAASKVVPSYQQPVATRPAPTFDIDNQGRPALGGYDAGADEFPGAQADLAITKDDGVATVTAGQAVHYTIAVTNAGPSAVALAPVTDTVPATLTGATWSCTAPGGSSCGAASGTGNITTTVNLPVGGSATFNLNATVATNANGTVVNTATVVTPAGTSDPSLGNNSATDTDTIVVPLPTLGLLDNFNRTNAANLNTGAPAGVAWSQTTGTAAVVRVNGNQANCALVGNCLLGSAIWNGATNVFGVRQGAAFTFTSTPAAALYLKAAGGAANAPTNFIRVRPQGAQLIVETTTNGGASVTNRGTFVGANFASGDRLTAVANADGSVDAWKTTAANVTSYLGRSTAVAAFGGTGRIGMQLLVTAQVDNFSGGTVP